MQIKKEAEEMSRVTVNHFAEGKEAGEGSSKVCQFVFLSLRGLKTEGKFPTADLTLFENMFRMMHF